MQDIERVYIHVPFCSHKCSYCAFHSIPEPQDYMIESYLEKLKNDIELSSISKPLKSLYLGGGTPNYLDEHGLEYLFKLLGHFTFDKDAEISIECNPESLNEDKIDLISSFANRISIGIQSFNPLFKKNIGRRATFYNLNNILGCFIARGITNISCDLIYGIPCQVLRDFKDDLNNILDLPIKHFSAYSLTLEENSALDGSLTENQLRQIEETSSEIWGAIPDMIASKDFNRYEVSNYAIKEYECKHNLAIWFGAKYLGFGPSASSFDGIDRWTNPYLEKWLSGGSPFVDSISYESRILEVFAMGLRTCEFWEIRKTGEDRFEINSRFNTAFNVDRKLMSDLSIKLSKLNSENLIELEGSVEDVLKVRSSELGLSFWNDLALEII